MLSLELNKAHFGLHLYVADVDNRIGDRGVKRLGVGDRGRTIDLVVHRRRLNDNLIAVEMK